jgi:hypothetical protein
MTRHDTQERGQSEGRETNLSGGSVEEAGIQGEVQVAEGDVHHGLITSVIGGLVSEEEQVAAPQHCVKEEVAVALL